MIRSFICVNLSFADEKVMADDEFTCDLFRFLQLLCEGHNNGGNISCFIFKLEWNQINIKWHQKQTLQAE